MRNIGYKKAIKECDFYLRKDRSLIIDASFHLRSRRIWLYKLLQKDTLLIILYTICRDLSETEDRIQKRVALKQDAFTQANSLKVYFHINKTFDEPRDSEFKDNLVLLIRINTLDNIIESILYYNFNPGKKNYISPVLNTVKNYLDFQTLKLRQN